VIPGDSEYAEPGGFAEMVNRVLMAIFRRVPMSVLSCAVCVAWDKATAEEFGEVWFENIPIMTLPARIEGREPARDIEEEER